MVKLTKIMILSIFVFSSCCRKSLKIKKEESIDSQKVLKSNPRSTEKKPRIRIKSKNHRAKANEDYFNKHFSSTRSGVPRGVFVVNVEKTPVFESNSTKAKTVGHLPKNTHIHAIEVKGEWVRIGRSKFVQKSDVRNLKIKSYPKR